MGVRTFRLFFSMAMMLLIFAGVGAEAARPGGAGAKILAWRLLDAPGMGTGSTFATATRAGSVNSKGQVALSVNTIVVPDPLHRQTIGTIWLFEASSGKAAVKTGDAVGAPFTDLVVTTMREAMINEKSQIGFAANAQSKTSFAASGASTDSSVSKQGIFVWQGGKITPVLVVGKAITGVTGSDTVSSISSWALFDDGRVAVICQKQKAGGSTPTTALVVWNAGKIDATISEAGPPESALGKYRPMTLTGGRSIGMANFQDMNDANGSRPVLLAYVNSSGVNLRGLSKAGSGGGASGGGGNPQPLASALPKPGTSAKGRIAFNSPSTAGGAALFISDADMGNIRSLFKDGEGIPGVTDGRFNNFDQGKPAAISDSGYVAFLASSTSPDSGTGNTLFLADDKKGKIWEVAKQGQPLTGNPDMIVNQITLWGVTEKNQVVAMVTASGDKHALVTADPKKGVRVLLKTGDTFPGRNANQTITIEKFIEAQISTFGFAANVGSAGHVVVAATGTTSNSTDKQGGAILVDLNK